MCSLPYLRVVCAEGGNDVPGLFPRADDGKPAGVRARRRGTTAATLARAAARRAVAAHQVGWEAGAVLGDPREVVARGAALLALLCPAGEVELGRRLHLPAAAAAATTIVDR